MSDGRAKESMNKDNVEDFEQNLRREFFEFGLDGIVDGKYLKFPFNYE